MSGLVQARHLLHAAGRGAPSETELIAVPALEERQRVVAEFVNVWRSELREHFDDEERLLLPLTNSAELRARLKSEHAALRDMARRCEQEPDRCAADLEFLGTTGQRLHDHIRWEERELFEVIQRTHPNELAGLAGEAAAIEERRPGARARRPAS